VTPGNPLKDNKRLPPLAERIAAARRMARHPLIDVTGFEAAVGTRYSYTTIGYLKRRCPGVRFVWLIGADSLAGFDRWWRWRAIAAALPIAVIDRPGSTLAPLGRRESPRARRGNCPKCVHPPGFSSMDRVQPCRRRHCANGATNRNGAVVESLTIGVYLQRGRDLRP
jgi:nicotinic acid mononucleotide adenylyltransferase